ncbi:unnamed protein product [Polarella glacialis]|uniref:Pentacotripeptide-repeat region of PRORP domain-containing protein n=1 Tax=Polarella glacialis TaxID=89957 RepID=A0A813HAB4_POLGL|nr:unnamed protein product [Polarella glacialis]
MEMYHEVREQGMPMNTVAFTALIDAHARAGDADAARALLEEMQKEGIQPNTITYSSLVKAYCVKADFDNALKTFGDMISSGLDADTVIFNTLLDGAVRASRFELCDQLLSEMAGYQVESSNHTLSIVVKMWGKRRSLDSAFEAVAKSLRERRLRLDSQICTCIISACMYNRAPDRAVRALGEMKSWPNCDGPDAGTYSMLVGGLLRCGRARGAAEVASSAARDLNSEAKRTAATRQHGRWNAERLSPETMEQLAKALHSKGLGSSVWLPLRHRLLTAGLL